MPRTWACWLATWGPRWAARWGGLGLGCGLGCRMEGRWWLAALQLLLALLLNPPPSACLLSAYLLTSHRHPTPPTQGIVLLGHSTGCQDIVRYLAVHGAAKRGMPPVLGAILEVGPAWEGVWGVGGLGEGRGWEPSWRGDLGVCEGECMQVVACEVRLGV